MPRLVLLPTLLREGRHDLNPITTYNYHLPIPTEMEPVGTYSNLSSNTQCSIVARRKFNCFITSIHNKQLSPHMLFSSPTNPQHSHKTVSKKRIQKYVYSPEDLIGQGFSSYVYKGRDEDTDERVAVKVVEVNMLKKEVYKDLLASEIYCLKLLKNAPNIIQLRDVYSTKNNTYVICELCNDTLSSLIARRKLSESEAIRFMQQLIRGYRQLQKLGILHRDIKPANIFLLDDQVRIADFGFATFTSEKKIQEKFNIGSPLYMPPESLLNNEYSFESDIWSLGVVFYEMLLGRAPWAATSERELLSKIMDTPILNLVPTSLSPRCVEFLRRTLDVNPKTRMTPEELDTFVFSNKPKPVFPGKHRSISDLKSNEVLGSTGGTSASTSSNGKIELAKQLFCRVHLCRFLFKLIIRIVDTEIQHSEFDGLILGLKNYLGNRMAEILSLETTNSLNINKLSEHRKTADFAKLIQVTKSYRVKYEGQLGVLSDNPSIGSSSFVLQTLSEAIGHLSLRYSRVTSTSLMSHQSGIVLLDYLITCFMLVKLAANRDIYNFAANARVEEIVEGLTTSVTFEQFKTIQSKAAAVKLL